MTDPVCSAPVCIVGAGLAGLTCAIELHSHDVPFLLLEASDRVGGRIRTDLVDGFQLDRGFQVLLTAYPETRRLLDYDALELGRFLPGSDVVVRGKRRRVADPLRRPRDGLRSVLKPTGNFLDLLKTGVLYEQLMSSSLNAICERPESTTEAYLQERRFSKPWIERFLRPFLGGIFLERDLETSSRMFEFVFQMFGKGHAALPARGMAAIPEQLAQRLPADRIHLDTPVASVGDRHVELTSGARVEASATVLATELTTARELLSRSSLPAVLDARRSTRRVTCLYFDAPKDPVGEPLLVLSGERTGVINNLCVPSTVRPEYAPEGRALVSVTVVDEASQDDPDLRVHTRQQLEGWFGESVRDWRTIDVQHVEHALPAQPVGVLEPVTRWQRVDGGPYICGDHTDLASIQGAMRSGRLVGRAIHNARTQRTDSS